MGNGFNPTWTSGGMCLIPFHSSERRAPLGPEARIRIVVAHVLSFFRKLNVTSRGDFRSIFINLFITGLSTSSPFIFPLVLWSATW